MRILIFPLSLVLAQCFQANLTAQTRSGDSIEAAVHPDLLERISHRARQLRYSEEPEDLQLPESMNWREWIDFRYESERKEVLLQLLRQLDATSLSYCLGEPQTIAVATDWLSLRHSSHEEVEKQNEQSLETLNNWLGNKYRVFQDPDHMAEFIARVIRWNATEVVLAKNGYSTFVEILNDENASDTAKLQSLHAIAFAAKNDQRYGRAVFGDNFFKPRQVVEAVLQYTQKVPRKRERRSDYADEVQDYPKLRLGFAAIVALHGLYNSDDFELSHENKTAIAKALPWVISVQNTKKPAPFDDDYEAQHYPYRNQPRSKGRFLNQRANLLLMRPEITDEWYAELSLSHRLSRMFRRHWSQILLISIGALALFATCVAMTNRSGFKRALRTWRREKEEIIQQLRDNNWTYSDKNRAALGLTASAIGLEDSSTATSYSREFKNTLKKHIHELDCVASRICTIGTQDRHVGTGFLMDEEGIIITCMHVWKDIQGEQAYARFDYTSEDESFVQLPCYKLSTELIAESDVDKLDYVAIRLLDPREVRTSRMFTSVASKVKRGQPIIVISHPGEVKGGIAVPVPLQYRIGEVLANVSDRGVLAYSVMTAAGCSGAPVFDESMTLVGMHRRTESGHEPSAPAQEDNQGIAIREILKDIKTRTRDVSS